MHLINLDATTRRHMIDEINKDIAASALYMSPRLSGSGRRDYPGLLLDAAENGDDASLAAALRVGGRLNATETATRNGNTFSKRVPVNAPETMAEGELNRFYIRGLCVRAIEEGVEEVIIYRAKAVAMPRAESQAKLGTGVSAVRLLEDLRVNRDIDPALRVPAGAGSGLSVRLPT